LDSNLIEEEAMKHEKRQNRTFIRTAKITEAKIA
jgi:hypothetical protein